MSDIGNMEEIKKLLNELQDNRRNLHDMLKDVYEFRKNLDDILPKTTDYRKKFLIAERAKTVTEVIKSELSIRSQIDSSIKLETDMRRKSSDEESSDQPNAIRAYAKALETLKNKEGKKKDGEKEN